MKITDFKLIKNRQRPDLCYSYVKYNEHKTEKYMLFTIDGGNSFLASIISTNNSGKLVDTDFSETFKTIEEGLDAIISYLANKNK